MQKALLPLEIDEEGYPVVGGLRIDDSHLLNEIFSNLTFVDQKNPRSALTTTFGGARCLLTPFSQPLVAQRIEWLNDQASIWYFLGGLKATVPHARVRIDAWNRLQTLVFEHEIPATATRQAQTTFLLHAQAPTSFEPYYPPSESTVLQSEHFWNDRYTSHETAWDLGRESPVLAAEWSGMRERLDAQKPLVVVGAGRGHDAHFLNAQGQRVLGLDSSPAAMVEARRLYSDLEFDLADAFDWMRRNGNVAAVFEHTFFCAIHPNLRRPWLEHVASALKPGGFYFGVFWFLYRPGGPPFGLTQWELREQSQDLFLIKDWHLSRASIERRFGQEYWIVFQKPH